MSKNVDLRKAAVAYKLSGYTLKETAEIFGVSKNAVDTWVKKYKKYEIY